jgi:hypothetical protein
MPSPRQMKPEQQEITRLKREVAKLKAERDILTIKEYNGRDWIQITRPNVGELKRLVAALEGRGCHIVLFELPSAPGVSETEYVKAAHILAKESFPGAEKWLAISDDRSELRWIDA